MPLVTPRTAPGTMELLPRQQVVFQRMLDAVRRGYERFGFLPIETPVFETVDVLLTKSGGETEKQVYFVQSTGALEQGKRPELALRFDLTVPLARYVAEHEAELAFPFRRYQIQRVYRGERAQKGRYREFYQCDIDVIGKDTLPIAYDAEIPAVIYTVFQELGVGPFEIRLSNRKILLGYMEFCNLIEPERQAMVLRAIDKLAKIGLDDVRRELRGQCGLDDDQVTGVLTLVTSTPTDLRDINGMLVNTLRYAGNNTLNQGLDELQAVLDGMRALGVPDQRLRVDLSITRGLDYYTGTVYETFLTDHPQIGSVCSGGRYDNLAGQYSKSRLPGVGISIGLTRLFYALSQAGLVQDGASIAQILVTVMAPELLTDSLAVATQLRDAGINTEVHLEPAKIARQMKYADRAGIPLVILIGTEEQATDTVTLKDMTGGEQVRVPRVELVTAVQQRLPRSGA